MAAGRSLTSASIEGSVRASAGFAAWRHSLRGVAGVRLDAEFYFSSHPRDPACAPGQGDAALAAQCCGRTMVAIGAALVIGFAAFPAYSGPVAMWLLPGWRSAAAVASTGEIVEARLAIQGMDCPAFAVAITHDLQHAPCVIIARVHYPSGRAVVLYSASAALTTRLVQAVAAGYHSRPICIVPVARCSAKDDSPPGKTSMKSIAKLVVVAAL